MSGSAKICVVDDDEAVRDSLRLLLQMSGYSVETFESATTFLSAKTHESYDCVITDIRMPDMDGLELQREIKRLGLDVPLVVMTGHGDVPLAVRAMKSGAVDFLEKPFAEEMLLDSIKTALSAKNPSRQNPESEKIQARVEELTPREKQVLDQIVDGHQNKMIAHNLNISVRTVEVYRARIMEKMKARTVADLVRLAMSART